MAEVRRGTNTERLAGHDGRQNQAAGGTDAGTLVVNDLAVVNIAGLAGQCVVCPLEGYIGWR